MNREEEQAGPETGGWQLGDIDLSEYLDRHRDQRPVLIIAPVGQTEPETYTCGVCGFVYNERGECPRCTLAVAEAEREEQCEGKPDILEQVRKLLDEADNGQA